MSIIIPAANAAGSLPLALASIAAQDYDNIVETVVASGDAETTAAAGDVRVIDNPTGSTPAGLNLAYRSSKGDVVVRCDSHSILPPGYVTRAVSTLQRTNAQNVGGMQVPVGQTYWERAIATAMSSPIGSGDARYRLGGPEGEVETVYLGAYPRQTLDDLEGFDESFTRTQDYELNHRIIESGGVVWFDPQLQVEYRPRGSLRALAGQYFEYGRAKAAFRRRHPGDLRWRQLMPPALLIYLMAAVLIGFFQPWALLALPLYPVAVLGAAAATGARKRGPLLGATVALITMHLTWGAGFFRG